MCMEKQELFSIGDVAKLFHISVSSLRHYEKIELVEPEYTDTQTGYRYYSTRQFERLNTIRYLRALDTPLEQIAEFFRNRDTEKMQDILRLQKEEVARKRRELEIVEKKIDNRLKQLQDAVSSELDTVRISVSPPQRTVWLRRQLKIESYLDLEIPIRQLELSQKNALVFLGKVGVGISKEHLLERKYSEYDMIFLLLDSEDDYDGKTHEIPQQTCVTLRFRGSHNEAAAQYEKLLSFIDEHNLKISGNSSEITMIDYGFTNDTSKFVTEIQIPVVF